MQFNNLLNHGNKIPKASNRKTISELVKAMETSSYNVLMAKEGSPKELAELVDKITSDNVTALVLQ